MIRAAGTAEKARVECIFQYVHVTLSVMLGLVANLYILYQSHTKPSISGQLEVLRVYHKHPQFHT